MNLMVAGQAHSEAQRGVRKYQLYRFRGKCANMRLGLPEDRGATTAANAAGDAGSLRKTAQLQEDFAEAGTVLEVHIDKFKSHSLRAGAANEGLRLDGSDALRQLEIYKRTGC